MQFWAASQLKGLDKSGRIQGKAPRGTIGPERLIGEERKKKVNKCNVDEKGPEKTRLHVSMCLPGVSSTREKNGFRDCCDKVLSFPALLFFISVLW